MIVLDTSIVYKWFDANEPDRTQARELLKNHKTGKNVIVIPVLLLYEISNIWATKANMEARTINKNIKHLHLCNLVYETMTIDLLKKITSFAREHNITAYDASYAVLAQQNNCDLITADEKFVKQVNLSFVKLLKDYA